MQFKGHVRAQARATKVLHKIVRGFAHFMLYINGHISRVRLAGHPNR